MTTETEIQDPQSEIDTEAAIAEISADLFRQGDESGEPSAATPAEQGKAPEASEPSAATTVEPSPTGEENTAEVQAVGAPKTWSKEALEKWTTIDPLAQAEILKREEDMHRGLAQYKERADLGTRYDSVVEPYRNILTSENIDPVQLFQSFAANHYLLSRGTPEQKIQLAAAMVDGYGIDFGKLIDYFGDRVVNPPNPELEALRREVAELRNGANTQRQEALNTQRAQIESTVAAFAADPAHPYFDELSEDIAKLINSGLAKDLPDAYEKAVFANPATREKELARLTAVNQANLSQQDAARKDKFARSTADHVTTTPTPRNGTVPVGSMDDTLASTLADIQARG